MHYALPPRKSATHHPTMALRPATSRSRYLRSMRPIHVVAAALAFILTISVLIRAAGSDRMHKARGSTDSSAVVNTGAKAGVVLVTMFDGKDDAKLVEMVKDNRETYAKRHGYLTFFPKAQDYTVKQGPNSWAKIPAMRHAMTLYPSATYFFHLDPHTLIMNPALSVHKHLLDSKRLESLMIEDIPVVPPDSVIKTYKGLPGDEIDLVITQDREGLSEKSFILRRGDWARYLLDAWFDPLYQTYNFQRAERHALEHIVQWHSTILAKLALVPQNVMNSYSEKTAPTAAANGIYKEGDFIINFGDCNAQPGNCETEMRPYASKATL